MKKTFRVYRKIDGIPVWLFYTPPSDETEGNAWYDWTLDVGKSSLLSEDEAATICGLIKAQSIDESAFS